MHFWCKEFTFAHIVRISFSASVPALFDTRWHKIDYAIKIRNLCNLLNELVLYAKNLNEFACFKKSDYCVPSNAHLPNRINSDYLQEDYKMLRLVTMIDLPCHYVQIWWPGTAPTGAKARDIIYMCIYVYTWTNELNNGILVPIEQIMKTKIIIPLISDNFVALCYNFHCITIHTYNVRQQMTWSYRLSFSCFNFPL